MAAAPAPAEPQLEHELQQEVSGITIQGYISNLHRQFETKLCDNRNHIITLSKNWNDNVSEIAALRDELNNIVAAASDPGVKDDGEPPAVAQTNEALHYIPDFSLLKHMGGDEINGFLKTEWLKLRREHECEIQKKTEELFRLKRAKDGAALPLRKERELESIKSKLLQTISKMDGIVSRKEGLNNCFDYDEDGELCRLKDRIASLLEENERLRGLLADKRKEAKQLSSQVVDAQNSIARHSLSESKLSNQIQKLCGELDDLKIESHLKDLLEQSLLKEVFGNYENQIDDGNQEECLLQELIMEKEEQLRAMSRDRQKLKYENDQLVSIVGSTLVQHHEEFDLVNDELMMYREKVCEQELLILEFRSESSSMKSCLYEALQQINVCKEEICGLTKSLTSMSVALEEAKEQNASLDATIREMKRTSASCVDGHEGHLEFDLVSMEKLSKAYSDFESRISQSMKQSEIRLTSIMCQFNPLVQQVSVLKKKEFWYKQILEIKCSNLRKAEAEVDILGDEVDTLLSVLGKIYIALDHYSPVLKHYPGVTEILNLVQKVLKGESV